MFIPRDRTKNSTARPIERVSAVGKNIPSIDTVSDRTRVKTEAAASAQLMSRSIESRTDLFLCARIIFLNAKIMRTAVYTAIEIIIRVLYFVAIPSFRLR